MKFLVDAQSPQRVATWRLDAGCDAKRTTNLADGNRTTDAQLIDITMREERVVVTKDADFVDSHALHGRPAKLLLVSAGNLTNANSESLLVPLIPAIVLELQTNSFLEVGSAGVVVGG